MYHGFPVGLLSLLRCPDDSGALALQVHDRTSPRHVRTGMLRCTLCTREYGIADGIVRFLDAELLDAESENERMQRDAGARNLDPAWERTPWNEMEMAPTLEASEPLAAACVLELGAGTGRYTVPMAGRGASIIAADFSAVSLEALAARVQPAWNIGLVQADCTHLAVAAGTFDLVASTFMSNLPTLARRAQTMRIAASACKATGRFVFSTHHYSLRSRLRHEPQAGYYSEAHIYRYLFRRDEIETEVKQYFADVDCHPIQMAFPLAGRIGLPVVKLSRLSERLPLLGAFGELLLVRAQRPLFTAATPRSRP